MYVSKIVHVFVVYFISNYTHLSTHQNVILKETT